MSPAGVGSSPVTVDGGVEGVPATSTKRKSDKSKSSADSVGNQRNAQSSKDQSKDVVGQGEGPVATVDAPPSKKSKKPTKSTELPAVTSAAAATAPPPANAVQDEPVSSSKKKKSSSSRFEGGVSSTSPATDANSAASAGRWLYLCLCECLFNAAHWDVALVRIVAYVWNWYPLFCSETKLRDLES